MMFNIIIASCLSCPNIFWGAFGALWNVRFVGHKSRYIKEVPVNPIKKSLKEEVHLWLLAEILTNLRCEFCQAQVASASKDASSLHSVTSPLAFPQAFVYKGKNLRDSNAPEEQT